MNWLLDDRGDEHGELGDFTCSIYLVPILDAPPLYEVRWKYKNLTRLPLRVADYESAVEYCEKAAQTLGKTC